MLLHAPDYSFLFLDTKFHFLYTDHLFLRSDVLLKKISNSPSTETMSPLRVAKLPLKSLNNSSSFYELLSWAVHTMFCQRKFSFIHSIETREEAIKRKKKTYSSRNIL